MAQINDSPFLKVLDRASGLAAAEQRGSGVRGGGDIPTPFPSSGAATIEGVLTTAETSINGQIASLRAYFRARPELLRLLDTSMKQEFKTIERRMRRYTLLSNVVFTVIGVVLGLLAPVALAAIVIALSSIGR